MILMNKDIPILYFDTEEKNIQIINNDMLPLQLKDYIKDSSEIKTISEGIKNYDILRHFFADRVLTISRDNAKQILQSISNTQKLTEEDSFQLALKCRSVSINDNFWTKNDDEQISFKDINIRTNSLSDIAFQISIKGTPISIQHDILAADISTKGMFRKTWIRDNNELWLYKSDKTTDYTNTKMEILVSNLLDEINYPHIKYYPEKKDDVFCCKCKCFTNDDISFIDAEYVKTYCDHHDINFIDFIKNNFKEEFANLVIIDYCFGNPDEHMNNWGFLIDANTNKIINLGPVFDNNQAMIIFLFNKEKEFDELIYPPTNKTMLESAKEWFKYSTIDLSKISDKNVQERYMHLKNLCEEKYSDLSFGDNPEKIIIEDAR